MIICDQISSPQKNAPIIMKATEILHKDIANAYPEIHKTRLNTLFTFVRSGLRDQRVTVTYLGRGLKSLSKTDKKHDIKRADRLIGNTNLHQERFCFYEHMTECLVGRQQHPLIIVDWSPINAGQIFQVLRASIPMGGRALTLYEKVYPESELNSEAAHQHLLDHLEKCLPTDCQPIIVSDAIFRTPWFKAIENKGWYWLGRVRGNITLSTDLEAWHSCKSWFKRATDKAGHVESIYYGKTVRFKCQGVLFRGKNKGRKKLNKRGGQSQCTTVKYQQQKAKEPWLLIFKLPKMFADKPQKVVDLYKQRMQIEESFRDTKNAKLGISLTFANSRSAERFDNLLLIAALMLFILWCIGYAVSALKGDSALQANTEKKRRVLSYIYLGREVIDDPRYEPDELSIVYVYSQLSLLTIHIDNLG
jgi:hypothetical protein